MTTFKAAFVRLAVALALATGGFAGPAYAQSEAEARVTALIAKSQPFQVMMIEAQEIFLDSVAQMEAAAVKGDEPLGKAEAQAWSSAWETKARARLAALKQRLATTPRITAAEARAVFGEADKNGLSELMAEIPTHIETTVAAAERTLNQTATLAPLAATGDVEAIDKMSKEIFAVGLYMVEIENQLLRNAIATMRPGHPQRSLAQAILGGNLAVMEIQRVNLRSFNGEPLAAQAAAGRARSHVAEATTAAKRIAAEAKAMMVLIAASSDDKAFVDKARKAFATFDESAQVELEGLRIIDEAAAALAREDFEKVFADDTKSDALVDRRVALQAARTTYLSQ